MGALARSSAMMQTRPGRSRAAQIRIEMNRKEWTNDEFVLRTGGHIHGSSSTFNALQFSYQAIPLRFSWGLIRRTAGA